MRIERAPKPPTTVPCISKGLRVPRAEKLVCNWVFPLALFRLFGALFKVAVVVRWLFMGAVFEWFLLEKFKNFSHLAYCWSDIAKNNGAGAGDFVTSYCVQKEWIDI